MTDKLFGTDGIRGRAYVSPLDEETVGRLGTALATVLARHHAAPRLLLAGDTRASTEVLAAWLAASFVAAGGRVTWAGVLPTPAVSHLLRGDRWDAGVVISASHNPAHDNGIKVLGPTGEKLDDADEALLESSLSTAPALTGPPLPAADPDLATAYLDLLAATFAEAHPLAGLRLVVDAANGAASAIAPALLARLGAEVVAMAVCPDGDNINRECGATCPSGLAARVVADGADAGLALDGDADRCILVDERGQVLDGDDILLAWARDLAGRDALPGGRVVATVMSNFGLEQALGRDGMSVVRCAVGDRAVWATMRASGAVLGGEQSGHVICSLHGVTGDGLLTGIHLLAVAARRRCRLSELSDLERMPQVLLNIPVVRKQPFESLAEVQRELRACERRLDGRGRILLRYSGTEPLARVMVEGADAAEIEIIAAQLAAAIRHEAH